VALKRSVATLANDGEFAAFSCCEGTDPEPWVQEAENYIRVRALRRSDHCLAFRDAGELVAVSAFSASTLAFPFAEPEDHEVWHLDVVGLTLTRQRRGHSGEVFLSTFAAMREIDPGRDAVTAIAHKDHAASLRACESAGLERLVPIDDSYWRLFGRLR
jgi:hypothetical protein